MSEQEKIEERLNRILEIGADQILQFKKMNSEKLLVQNLDYRVRSLEYFDSILKGVLAHYRMSPKIALKHILNIHFSIQPVLTDVKGWLDRFEERQEYNSKIAALEQCFIRLVHRSEELEEIINDANENRLKALDEFPRLQEVIDIRNNRMNPPD